MTEVNQQKNRRRYNLDNNENQQTDQYNLQVADSKIAFCKKLNHYFMNNDQNDSNTDSINIPLSFGSRSNPRIQQSNSSYLMTESSYISDLERENLHFVISEAVISAIEFRKHNRNIENVYSSVSFCSSNSCIYDTSDSELQRIRVQKEKFTYSLNNSNEESISNSLSSIEDNSNDFQLENNVKIRDCDLLSLSMVSLYSEADLKQTDTKSKSDNLSAEELAINLLKKCQIKHPSFEYEVFNNVSKSISPNNSMINQSSIVLTLHKSPKLKNDIVLQNYKCADCNTIVLPKYASKFRYCYYFGKYFCTFCHQNQLSLIPAKILFRFNFNKYRVSKLAFKFLTKIYETPILNIFEIKSHILNEYKCFQKYNRLRNQLYLIKDYILNCRFADKFIAQLEKLPKYFYCNLKMFSIKDLVEIKDNKMLTRLSDLVNTCNHHILSCILCSAKGHICEICKNDDILFPWHTKITTQCLDCMKCYHSICWDSKINDCPKCIRQLKQLKSH